MFFVANIKHNTQRVKLVSTHLSKIFSNYCQKKIKWHTVFCCLGIPTVSYLTKPPSWLHEVGFQSFCNQKSCCIDNLFVTIFGSVSAGYILQYMHSLFHFVVKMPHSDLSDYTLASNYIPAHHCSIIIKLSDFFPWEVKKRKVYHYIYFSFIIYKTWNIFSYVQKSIFISFSFSVSLLPSLINSYFTFQQFCLLQLQNVF